MEAALYDPEWGFYATGGHAGRRGDFITSVEVGPLFGAVIARALDAWWHELGSPRPFVVVDAGAGVGTLARAVLAAAPECAAALRYVLVERSATLRAEHDRGLPVVLPVHTFAAPREPDDEDEQPARLLPDGPLVVSLESLPPTGAHVVLANELLDNLPVRLLERTAEGWSEVGVGSDFEELLLPVDAAACACRTSRLLRDRASHGRRSAVRWLRDGARAGGSGRRLRLHDHDRADGCSPLDRLAAHLSRARSGQVRRSLISAEQDITCEVALDQLAAVRPPSEVRDQKSFLGAHGVDALVDEGRTSLGAGRGPRGASRRCAVAVGSARRRRSPISMASAGSPLQSGSDEALRRRRRSTTSIAARIWWRLTDQASRRRAVPRSIRSRGTTCAICVRAGAW